MNYGCGGRMLIFLHCNCPQSINSLSQVVTSFNGKDVYKEVIYACRQPRLSICNYEILLKTIIERTRESRNFVYQKGIFCCSLFELMAGGKFSFPSFNLHLFMCIRNKCAQLDYLEFLQSNYIFGFYKAFCYQTNTIKQT